jgi:hypothetical protein
MKQVFVALIAISSLAFSCKSTGAMATIQPKYGTIDLPATGELRMWRDVVHPSFNVTLTNNASNQSCELYKVTDNRNEKWISPSLMAGKSITVSIPANGHLFLKNFNPNVLKIEYKIEE